ncbi:hypothetical protein [Bartonella sp. HY038]|nr:hypothetical protein [Bartonella sp. HY038]
MKTVSNLKVFLKQQLKRIIFLMPKLVPFMFMQLILPHQEKAHA